MAEAVRSDVVLEEVWVTAGFGVDRRDADDVALPVWVHPVAANASTIASIFIFIVKMVPSTLFAKTQQTQMQWRICE